jgi:Ca2+-binding EF-hand superfamily protein
MLRKIFKDFDLNQSGTLTIDEMGAMLAKLGISVDRKYINAIMRELDTNKTGMLEFEEFVTFLIYDPYK